MLVLDIETIPLIDEYMRDEFAAAANADDPHLYASTLPPLAQIVCVGMVNEHGVPRSYVNEALFPGAGMVRGGASSSKAGVILGLANEEEVIECTLGILNEYDRYPIVTFSGRTFDLPMLFAAALRHKIRIPVNVYGLMTEYRFSKTPNHIDIREMVTFYGATKGGLRAWCYGLGLGDPKAGGDGSQVAQLVAEGKWKEVAEYCLSDCKFTADLYHRWKECTA